MTSDITMLQRRTEVSAYARNRLADFSHEELAEIEANKEKYRDIDLSREHEVDEQTLGDSATAEELEEILHRMGKFRPEDILNCGACGYEGCLEHARAVYAGLADSEMCLPHTIEQLRFAYDELEESHRSLEDAQDALERSTKLASMGQLAAGIAHEVNNPLGTLLLHANLLLEECEDESQTKEDLETIVDQANRCKRIISGLLNFARQSRVVRQPTDVAELVDKVVRMTPVEENVSVQIVNGLSDPIAEIDADQMVQVLTNLLTNAQHAMPEGGTLTIHLSDDPETVTFRVSDTGEGISQGEHDQAVRPVLHHQAGRHGHRSRAGGHSRHRQDAPGPDLGGVERRSRRRPHRHDFHHHAAAPRGAEPRWGGCRGGFWRDRRSDGRLAGRSAGAERWYAGRDRGRPARRCGGTHRVRSRRRTGRFPRRDRRLNAPR